MPAGAFLPHSLTQPAFSGMYALADIFREELDLPIPDCPHTGYVPRQETIRPPLKHRKDDESSEQCDAEYHADDEMTEPHSPTTVEYEPDSTNAAIREERLGVTEQIEDARSDVSPFSYYYYPNPDYEQQPYLHGMNYLVLRSFLNMVEDTPLTQAESWVKCKTWRCQVAKATGITNRPEATHGETVCIDASSQRSPGFSIFQILHDQPVDAIDKTTVVSKWRRAIIRGSFSSIPPAPPSLVSYLARRRSSLVSTAKVLNLDPDVHEAGLGRPVSLPTDPPMELKVLAVMLGTEELGSETVPALPPSADCSAPDASKVFSSTIPSLDPSAAPLTAPEPEDTIEPVRTFEEQTAEPADIFNTLNIFKFPTFDVQVFPADRHSCVISRPEFTAQHVRSMISILTAPSSDIRKLKTFWEGQK